MCEHLVHCLKNGYSVFREQAIMNAKTPKTNAACHDINSECVLCYRCALPNFKELAYQFRREAWESADDHFVIDFSFASDWLKEWCEFSGPITKRCQLLSTLNFKERHCRDVLIDVGVKIAELRGPSHFMQDKIYIAEIIFISTKFA
nr:uncharacterized protein LOC131784646 [Pocillopora verrucosa]